MKLPKTFRLNKDLNKKMEQLIERSNIMEEEKEEIPIVDPPEYDTQHDYGWAFYIN